MMAQQKRIFRAAALIGLSWVATLGPAFSHVVSVFVPHSHVSAHYSHGVSHGGGFWHWLFGLQDPEQVILVPAPMATAGYMGVDERPPLPPAQSDEDRYRTATGLALAPRHGLVIVPPATAKGDVTYIWSNSGEN